MNTYEDCKRKWAWAKLDGLDGGTNRYAAYGTRVHKIIQQWFSDRVPPPNTPEGKTARKIIAHLPPPQTPGILIEREMDLVLGGVPFKGFVDFSIFEGRERPFVSDHKSCGSFTFALTPDTMPDDVQVSNYSYEAMLRTNSNEVDVQWTYGTRDGKRSLPIVRTITYDDIKPRLEKTAQTAEEMRMIFEAAPPAIEVPYDASACEKYGGCPFKDNCNLTAREGFRSIMAQSKEQSKFLDKLKKKQRGNGAEPQTHPPAAAEEKKLEVVPPVPTNSGTVNPPSAPATAPANPEGEPPKEKKKKAGRRSRSKPAETSTPASPTAAAPKPPKPAAAPSAEPVDDRGSIADALAVYRQGFLDGAEFMRGLS